MELRGYREVENPAGVKGELLEPITYEEALKFLKFFTDDDIELSDEELRRNASTWLQPSLEQLVETLTELIDAGMFNWDTAAESLGRDDFDFSEDDWRRLKISVERDNIGGDWCYQSPHGIGIREGVTTEQARQNDELYSKLDQHHAPGERVDGKLIFSEELKLAESVNLFDSLFDRRSEAPDKDKHGKPCPAVRTWSDQNLYMRRCSQERNERFAETLWRILTWPIEVIDETMPALRDKYKQSVRANAPGPRRERIGGTWRAAPLTGEAAFAHLRKRPGTLKGKVMSKQVRVHTGHTWHKLRYNKDHMKALEDAYLWRQGIIKVRIGDDVVEEKFENTMESLPLSYIRKTYGEKKKVKG